MSLYVYRATLLRIVDADTVHLDIDLGLDTHRAVTVRLHGINAPERGTPEGRAAASYLGYLLPPHSVLRVHTVKDRREKYGRYLAELWRAGDAEDSPSVNERLVVEGHAVAYLGEARRA